MGGKYFYLKTHDELANFEKIIQIENSSNEIFSINNQGLISSKGINNNGDITNIGSFTNTGNANINGLTTAAGINNNGNITNTGTFTNTGNANINGLTTTNGIDNNGSITNSGTFTNTGNVTTNGLTTANGKFNLKSQLPETNTDNIFTIENNSNLIFRIENQGRTTHFGQFNNYGNIANEGIFTNEGETRLKGETIANKKIKIHMFLDNSSENLFEIENNIKQLMTVDNNGLLKARRIIVNQDNWADFVFEKDYKLPTLYEIERYIKKHKHLPNIPNTKEVKENGNDLAKMNALLLQKIEELTLHAIQQQKELDEIKRILLENKKK